MLPRPLILCLALFACSPAAPPPAAAPAPAPAAPPPATAPEPPSARVIAVEPSKESAQHVRAKIVFSNPSRVPCRVAGYKVTWAGKSKSITLDDLTLPPGETRERWLKVSPDDGDVAALGPESAKVDLRVECAP